MRTAVAALLVLLGVGVAVWLLAGPDPADDAAIRRDPAQVEPAGPVALVGREALRTNTIPSPATSGPPAPSADAPTMTASPPTSPPGRYDLTGRVTLADGLSRRVVTVRVFGAGGRQRGWARTGPGGRFHLELTGPAERLDLVAEAASSSEREPLAPAVVLGIASGTTDLDIRLVEGTWVEGRVVDGSGDPIGAHVKAHMDEGGRLGSVRTGEDGGFRIAVSRGPVLLYAEPSTPLGAVTASAGVEVHAPVADVRLVCGPARTIRGRVQGAGDARGCSVGWAHALPDGTVRSLGMTIAHEDGAFALPGAPFAPVMLVCRRGGADPRCASVEVPADGEGPVTLTLAEGLAISGRIATEGDAPPVVPEGRVAAVGVRHVGLGLTWYPRVDAQGAFTLRGLLPGTYEILAVCEGYRIERALDVRAPASDVVLRARR